MAIIPTATPLAVGTNIVLRSVSGQLVMFPRLELTHIEQGRAGAELTMHAPAGDSGVYCVLFAESYDRNTPIFDTLRAATGIDL